MKRAQQFRVYQGGVNQACINVSSLKQLKNNKLGSLKIADLDSI